MGGYSSLLFGESSFVEGFSRVLDLGGVAHEYNESLSPDQADRLALRADVLAIGEDFKNVIRSNPPSDHMLNG